MTTEIVKIKDFGWRNTTLEGAKQCTLYLFSGVGLTVEFACSNRFSMFKRKFGNDKYKLHIDI